MYRFYFGKLLLPVTPPKLELKINNKNETCDLLNGSEINRIKAQGLTDISFEALIPVLTRYPFARYEETDSDRFKDWANTHGYRTANSAAYNADKSAAFLSDKRNITPATVEYFLEAFELLKTEKRTFQFIVLRDAPNGTLLWDTNITCTLEDYTITEDAEDGSDIAVSFNLKQFISYGTKFFTVQSNSKTAKSKPKAAVQKARPVQKPPTRRKYTVRSGDCLWNIAKKQYGNSSRWKDIYNTNKSTIEATAKKYGRASSSNGWWIYPGEVLTIP